MQITSFEAAGNAEDEKNVVKYYLVLRTNQKIHEEFPDRIEIQVHTLQYKSVSITVLCTRINPKHLFIQKQSVRLTFL